MKKYFLALFLVLAIASQIWAAAGTVVVVEDKVVIEGKMAKKIITLTCTGGTAGEAGTVPNTTLPANIIKGWYLYSAETNPGAGPPDANYDIVINDADGVDVANGLLMNRHTSTTELVNLGMGVYGYPLITGALTIVQTNQTTASAVWVITLTFVSE